MATRAILTPESAHFPSTNFPMFTISNTTERRPVLGFDAATKESAYWTIIAPAGLTGTLTLVVSYIMASATSGNVVWLGAVEAVTSGDGTPNLSSASSFDTDNSVTDAVPATAGLMKQASITLTTNDSMAAGDYVRIAVRRDAANGSDTATGDAQIVAVEFKDAA